MTWVGAARPIERNWVSLKKQSWVIQAVHDAPGFACVILVENPVLNVLSKGSADSNVIRKTKLSPGYLPGEPGYCLA